jgi:single-strand DNA-binding protein
MSRGLNKVMVIGHLGRDPEMRYTPSGRPVTTFSVATSRSWTTSGGERRTQTEWFNIVAWGSLAEICNQYLTKGQQVFIEGRLQTRRWDDEEGNRRSTVEVVAKEMIMLGDRKQISNDKRRNDNKENNENYDSEEIDDSEEEDEFPF